MGDHSSTSAADSPQKPHYHGHRARLRERFLHGGPEALAEYEILEMLLFNAKPRGDVKPLAKALLARFGSLGRVIAAPREALAEMDGMGDAAVASVKLAQAAAVALLREEAMEQPVINSWQKLLDYCRAAMMHEPIEQFRVLYLNKKNRLIADEVQQTGTVDHTPAYPREIVKRALELGASAIIVAHNHPSGDPSPSKADITMTEAIHKASATVGIALHDHLIIARGEHFSFKSHGLL